VAEEDLVINIKLNRQQAQEQVQAHIADAKHMEQATKDSVSEQTKAVKAGAKTASSAITAGAAEQVQAMKGVGKEAGSTRKEISSMGCE
jgi:hypothetical protein